MNTSRTLKELAEWSGINYYTLVSAAQAGRLVAHKSGSTWLSTRQDVEDYQKIAVFKPRNKVKSGQTISRKLARYIDTGLWTENASDVIASAFQDIGGYEDGGEYILNFHKGEMPAYDSGRFESLRALEYAMREFEPDMRKWRFKASL